MYIYIYIIYVYMYIYMCEYIYIYIYICIYKVGQRANPLWHSVSEKISYRDRSVLHFQVAPHISVRTLMTARISNAAFQDVIIIKLIFFMFNLGLHKANIGKIQCQVRIQANAAIYNPFIKVR